MATPEFFFRIEHLSLTPGPKQAGFVLTLCGETAVRLRAIYPTQTDGQGAVFIAGRPRSGPEAKPPRLSAGECPPAPGSYWALLRLDVLLDDGQRRPAARAHEVAAAPEHRFVVEAPDARTALA